MIKILKYILIDILKNRFVIGYTVLLAILSWAFFGFEINPEKAVLSLLSLNLIVVPLVCLVFPTIYLYNATEFTELLATQPIGRRSIFLSQYLGIALSMILAFLIGVGLPVMAYGGGEAGLRLILTGTLLSLVFVSLSFLAVMLTADKAKGIGITLALWFFFALLYDGLVLLIYLIFSDYPLDFATMGFAFLNPIDLARILVLVEMDVSAILGLTGALFKDFFGSTYGLFFALVALLLWFIWPVLAALKIFIRKDL
ncbi:ABC transporter permease subunit [Jiulongibacter sediminis]|uniref:Nitrous oxide reductase n=1 Tax=Jiulongibacter sediminis TaxID=1605367 RepID=A0A0N8H9A0_9BACT|nr:ABC transporter permease subunit [Jiulongibacter sediminis]KPM46788.1 nitrous oxide reductase [Jiulongibacter sediminis]TBX21692.1 nitrous oxide reductase [Jiulongibacter sediminis]